MITCYVAFSPRLQRLWLCLQSNFSSFLLLAFTVCCATAAHGAGSADGLLAYEPFAGQAGPLSQQSSGFGWSAGWSIQNNDVKVPGYNLAVSGPMQYIGLSQSGNYAVGGSTYQTAGRSLDVTPTGPFAQYLSSGTVGASGKSIWLSLLLRKDVNTDDEASATLLASQVAWWGQVGKISVGYFGQSSNSGGSRYWSLKIAGTVYPTSARLTVGQAALLVVRIDFGVTTVANLFVSPTVGASDPGIPDAQVGTSSSLAFNSLAYNGGISAGKSSIDEIRFGTTYVSVVPSNVPPASPSNLTVAAGDAEVSLSWQLSPGASSYRIWGATDGHFSILAEGLTSPRFGFRGLTDGLTYSYYVTALNAIGESIPSSIVTATPTAGASPVLNGLLAYDPFDSPPGPLFGTNSGAGWAKPWDVQWSSTAVPGFNTAAGTPLSFGSLPQSGNYAIGGYNYGMSGRSLDVSATGPFADYLSGGLIGANGRTLWFGLLMRKDMTGSDEFSATLHSASLAWWVSTSGVSIGYFGANSESGGIAYWSLKVDGVVYPTGIPVAIGQPALLVLRLDFGAMTTARLYVNPPPGGALPDTADAQASTQNSLVFQSLAWASGAGPNQNSIDEIRFAGSYQALVTATATVPAAPSGLTATPGNNQVSLSWSPVAGASSYQVWVSTGGAFQLLATTASTSFTDTSAVDGISYSYSVVAVTSEGGSLPSGQVVALPREPSPIHTVLGTNLSMVVDWTREWPFVDAFKLARTWISQRHGAGWGQGGPLQLTPDGWIAALDSDQYAETIVFDNGLEEPPDYPTGQYALLYDGQGTIAFDLGTATIVSQSPGRMVVNVLPNRPGIYLMITQTNPADPIRNIRFIMPGFENTYQTQRFHPLFLSTLQSYRALRFMEWMLTNGSSIKSWADRPTPNDYTQTQRGVALETMIQLANTLKVSPWFNMPHAVDDDYVRQFAAVVNQQLDPSLKVYIEYSNETWNNTFSQTTAIRNWGQTLGLSQNPTLAGAYYTAQRSVQIFQIWEQIFGGTDRLVRVLPSQAANPWLSEQIVAYQNAFAHADALAIAPYFECSDAAAGGWGNLGDPAAADQVAAMTVDQILDIELGHIRNCALNQMIGNAAVAQKYGLKLVAYEGGQSLVAWGAAQNNSQLTQLFEAANRSPRMQDLYSEYLNNWKNAGGDLFLHYTDVSGYTKYGSFGSLESQDQDSVTAPKYRALMNFAAQNP